MTSQQKRIIVSALEVSRAHTAVAVRKAITPEELTDAAARYEQIGSVLRYVIDQEPDDV